MFYKKFPGKIQSGVFLNSRLKIVLINGWIKNSCEKKANGKL